MLTVNQTHLSYFALSLQDDAFSKILTKLNTHPITHLKLIDCQLRDQEAILLAKALETKKTIIHVDLSGNHIELNGEEALLKVMNQLPKWTLILTNNKPLAVKKLDLMESQEVKDNEEYEFVEIPTEASVSQLKP